MMNITFDTNCLINYYDTQSRTATSVEEISQLLRYATAGRISVAITTRAEADLDQDPDAERRKTIKRHLAMFDVIASVLRWDISSWGNKDIWANDKTGALADEIQKVLFPNLELNEKRFGNKIRDIDHLVAHALDNRDIFVTDDGHLNKRSGELEKLGIVVMTPAECLRYIEDVNAHSKPRTLTPDVQSGYISNALSGTATFDYSNNNGSFSFGGGHFLFETKWSKASNTSIHAYSDAGSIDGIALVKDVEDIDDITDTEAYDYSSRSRSPRTGQIVLWRNLNGIYAATKVLKIEDDSRGDASDTITFDFKVITNGTSFKGVR